MFATTACVGEIRKTTTKRTAEELLLMSNAAERAITEVKTKKLKGKTVFVDVANLAAMDKEYVISSFQEICALTGAKLSPARDKADLIVELRVAGLANDDSHWTVGIPTLYVANSGVAPAAANEKIPPLIEIGWILHEGWARIQGFAYERKTGKYVFGWRNAWGYAHRGFFEDIYPEKTIGQTLGEFFK
jgi:hypothetical protein